MILDKLHKSTKILGKKSSKQAPSQITLLTCFNFITAVLYVEFYLMDNFSRTLDRFFTMSGFLSADSKISNVEMLTQSYLIVKIFSYETISQKYSRIVSFFREIEEFSLNFVESNTYYHILKF